MARSVWKGPFVDPKLLKKVRKAQEAKSKDPKNILLLNLFELVALIFSCFKLN